MLYSRSSTPSRTSRRFLPDSSHIEVARILERTRLIHVSPCLRAPAMHHNHIHIHAENDLSHPHTRIHVLHPFTSDSSTAHGRNETQRRRNTTHVFTTCH
jgi:hypothetical protein